MVYSCSVVSTMMQAKELLQGSSSVLSARKIQTSDPSEINEEYIVSELGLKSEATTTTASGGSEVRKLGSEEGRSFARPKGPGRKR